MPKWNPWLYALAPALAIIVGPRTAAGGTTPRTIGLIGLGLLSLSLAWVGARLGSAPRWRDSAAAEVTGTVAKGRDERYMRCRKQIAVSIDKESGTHPAIMNDLNDGARKFGVPIQERWWGRLLLCVTESCQKKGN